MEKISNLPDSAAIPNAVLSERLRALTEAVEDIKNSLQHMATKEQVAQLVSRSEFDRARWDIEQLRKDHERTQTETGLLISKSIEALRGEIERASVKSLWKNLTTVVAGLSGILALIVALTGWRPN